MRKTTAYLCGYAGVAGAIGALIRWIQLGRIVEDSGLLLRGSAWSTVLTAYLILVVLGLVLLVVRLRRLDAPLDYRSALHSRSVFYPIAASLLGVVMAVAAVLLFLKAGDYKSPLLQRLLALLALCSAACMPALAIGPKKGGDGALMCLGSAVPVLFFCFWLIVSYKEHAADPSTWVFAIEILAICSAILAFFFMAGYSFERAKPMRALFFALLCALMCIVTLADDRPTAKQLLFLATACMELMQAAALCSSLRERGDRALAEGEAGK